MYFPTWSPTKKIGRGTPKLWYWLNFNYERVQAAEYCRHLEAEGKSSDSHKHFSSVQKSKRNSNLYFNTWLFFTEDQL